MKEKEISEAVQMITLERKQGKDVEDCTKMLSAAGFTHEEIEKVMEESDKVM